MSIFTDFGAYGEWRGRLTEFLERFRSWLDEHDLNDAQGKARLTSLLQRLHEDNLYVAFVAEFSRGKSELINAIFFAEYGNRVLPSSAGRTTMCPTELLYDASRPPYIDLLPIQTRNNNAQVSEYKKFPDEWYSLPLDITSTESMKGALQQVSQLIRVMPEEATALGFRIGTDQQGNDHCQVGKDGMVEIPRWRHAIINFPHKLLKEGLVILDTPGLNAIGSEPELTLSLLPNAHAVLFILAADTGVTQSDLSLWRDHILVSGNGSSGRMVVMNKIDGLWDELRDERSIKEEIQRQSRDCAATLHLPVEMVYPVSAQKGLVAKVQGDETLLDRSRLNLLERALSERLVHNKQHVVSEGVSSEFYSVYLQVKGLLESRLSALNEQLGEINELRGKNKNVVGYMMGKVRNEKEEFEAGLLRYYAVRSVFSTLSNNLFGHLSLESLQQLNQETRDGMQESFFSKSMADAMRMYFDSIYNRLDRATAEVREIIGMMEVIYKKFNIEHGLSLNLGANTFSLLRHEKEVERLEYWCDTHLVTPMSLLTQGRMHIIEKFFDEVTLQIRKTFQIANRDADVWLKAIMAPMETQVREHQSHLKRRLESIKRIHQATDTLEDRIGELDHVGEEIRQLFNALQDHAGAVENLLQATPTKGGGTLYGTPRAA